MNVTKGARMHGQIKAGHYKHVGTTRRRARTASRPRLPDHGRHKFDHPVCLRRNCSSRSVSLITMRGGSYRVAPFYISSFLFARAPGAEHYPHRPRQFNNLKCLPLTRVFDEWRELHLMDQAAIAALHQIVFPHMGFGNTQSVQPPRCFACITGNSVSFNTIGERCWTLPQL